MKKYLLFATGIVFLSVLILIVEKKRVEPKEMETLYVHTAPSCIKTTGEIVRPKRALNPWPLTYDPHVFTRLADLQVKWIRHEFLWESIEPQPGKFQWDEADRIVRKAHAHNVNILGLLDYSAPWATKRGHPYFPPTALEDYTTFVSQVVARYRPGGLFAQQEAWQDGYGITHWEIWNEPNGPWFWQPLPNVDDYVEMLHQTNLVIRKLDRNAVILHGGLDPAGDATQPDAPTFAFLDKMYERGGKDCFDVVNLHPYLFSAASPIELNEKHLRRVKKTMAKYGDEEKPIWLTEFGYHSGQPGKESHAWVTEEQQAEYLSLGYQEIEKGSFDALFWFALGDGPEGETYGLLRNDLSPKPAYWAYRNLPFP